MTEYTYITCPVPQDAFVRYRTFYFDKGQISISHIHHPIRASEINWGDKGKQTIGRIYDYEIVK